MDFINLLVVAPSGLWTTILNAFESFLLNYAWAVILLTILIRIALIPIDFVRQKSSRDNMRMQATIGPQLQSLQKKYGHDKNLLNQKTMELYKANNFNVMGVCLPMLVYMALTLVIFITLFGTLNHMSSYKLEEQFLTLKNEYTITYDASIGNGATTDEAELDAENAVLAKYDEVKNSFLWVNNVWVADTPWQNAILSYNDYITAVGNVVKDLNTGENVELNKLSTEERQVFMENYQAEYEKVMGVLLEQRNTANGYLLTTVLAMAVAFLAQWLSQRRMVAKNSQNGQAVTASTNKAMLVILPLIMGVFTLFYNAVFGLYLVASQIVSIFTLPVFDKILDGIYAKKDAKLKEKNQVDYRRK